MTRKFLNIDQYTVVSEFYKVGDNPRFVHDFMVFHKSFDLSEYELLDFVEYKKFTVADMKSRIVESDVYIHRSKYLDDVPESVLREVIQQAYDSLENVDESYDL